MFSTMPKGRIFTLDILRGYFLLVILTDHLYRFPNLLQFFTGRGQLWVSAAEGFFMISGLLVGFIYRPKISRGFKKIFRKLWRRAAKLYVISVSLTLLFTLWGQFLPADKIKSGIWPGGNLVQLLYKTATFQYVYGWADFLVFYAVFMFFAPIALWLIAKFNGWVVMVLSVLVWYFFRLQSEHAAWQLLFMSGLLVGGNLLAIEEKFSALASRHKKLAGAILSGVTLLTIILSIYFVFGFGRILPPENVFNFLAPLVDKNTVGPLRFILAWIWFAALYLLVRFRENQIDRVTGGIIRTLGQDSLLVYSLEAILLYPVNFLPSTGFAGSSVVTLAAFAVVYLSVLGKKAFLPKKLPVKNCLSGAEAKMEGLFPES